jgi:hypothetical protein
MDMQTSKEDHWYAHLRYWNNLPLFPREFGLNRTQVYREQYLFLLSKWFNLENCYTAVYSEGQIEQSIYDTLFLEARDETESLEQVLMDRDMIKGALARCDIACRHLFSGGRSYHFYLDFPPIPVPNLSAMARNFVDEMDIADLLDMHTVGNRRSMARIVHTYNERTDRFAVYYDGNDETELDYISANNIIMCPPIVELQETAILKHLRPDDDYNMELIKPATIAFNGIYPDCVLNIMFKLRNERHATHDERIHLVAYLYKLGWSFDDMVNIFRDATDFNPTIAEYHVRSLVAGNYRPYACSRVKTDMRNICPFAGTGRFCHYIQNVIQQSRLVKG